MLLNLESLCFCLLLAGFGRRAAGAGVFRDAERGGCDRAVPGGAVPFQPPLHGMFQRLMTCCILLSQSSVAVLARHAVGVQSSSVHVVWSGC